MHGLAQQHVLAVLLGDDHLAADLGRVFLHWVVEREFSSSTSIITAAAVIGCDCDAIQNSASVFIARPAATSAKPTASTDSTWSLSATSRLPVAL
jgi:hypothetical protein